jgi:hypothetical protein
VPVTRVDVGRYRIAPGRLQPLRTAFYAGEIDRKEVWYERPIDRHWRAAYRLHLEYPGTKRARFVIAEVRVLPIERENQNPGEWSAAVLGQRARCPRGGIPARVMTQVRSRATLAAVQLHVQNALAHHGPAETALFLRLRKTADLPKQPAPARRGRPPARTMKEHQAFAKRWTEAERHRTTRASNRRVMAAAYGVPETTIANWVRQCRRLALLPPARLGSRYV